MQQRTIGQTRSADSIAGLTERVPKTKQQPEQQIIYIKRERKSSFNSPDFYLLLHESSKRQKSLTMFLIYYNY